MKRLVLLPLLTFCLASSAEAAPPPRVCVQQLLLDGGTVADAREVVDSDGEPITEEIDGGLWQLWRLDDGSTALGQCTQEGVPPGYGGGRSTAFFPRGCSASGLRDVAALMAMVAVGLALIRRRTPHPLSHPLSHPVRPERRP
jgi:uncharacterized protein (TIGR03382 family)